MKRKSKVNTNISLARRFEQHVLLDIDRHKETQDKLLEIKGRMDSWNGAIPFIKEGVKNVQEAVDTVHNKIDILNERNADQDQRIAKTEEVADWVRRVFIFGGSGSLLTGIGVVLWKFVVLPMLGSH